MGNEIVPAVWFFEAGFGVMGLAICKATAMESASEGAFVEVSISTIPAIPAVPTTERPPAAAGAAAAVLTVVSTFSEPSVIEALGFAANGGFAAM